MGNSKVKMDRTVRSFWSEKRQEMAETGALLNFFFPQMHFRKGDRERMRTSALSLLLRNFDCKSSCDLCPGAGPAVLWVTGQLAAA